MSTRQEQLKRHQAALEARKRLESGTYNQPQEPYKSTRLRNMEAYNNRPPLPSSFSGDPETSMLNVPDAINSFQAAHAAPSVQPDYLKPKAKVGSAQALQDFQRSAPAPAPKAKSKGVAAVMSSDLGAVLDHATFGLTKPVTKWFENYITNENEATKVAPGQINQKKLEIGKQISGLAGDVAAGGVAFKGAKLLANPFTSKLPALLERTAAPIASRLGPTAGAVTRIGAQQLGKTAGIAATGAAAGALYQIPNEATDAAYGGKQSFGGRLKDIGVAAALGGAGDVAVHGAGEWAKNVKALFKKNGIPDSEIEAILGTQKDTLSLPLGREDAARARTRPINGTDPITPEYTFKLPEGSEAPTSAAKNADGAAHQVSYDEQVVREYKVLREQPDSGMSLRETYAQAKRNVDERVNAPTRTTDATLKSDILKATNKPKRMPGDTPFAEQPAPEAPPVAAAEQPFTAGAEQNYAGNQIPFRQATAQDERQIARNQVVKNMRKNLGIVIDTGRLNTKNKNVLGQYKIKPEVVRSRMAEDLQVISHEIGHHLDKKFKLVSDPQYHGELSNLLHQTGVVNTAAYQPGQLAEEGIAEYVRLRLTDPAQARQLAPGFTSFFDQSIGSKTLKGLEASAKDVDTWITQGDFNQALGLLDFDSGTKKTPFSFERTYTKFVDDLNPLKLVEKALNKTVGIGKDSIYKMARISRGIGERAKLAVTRGIYDDTGKKVSDGLAKIVKPLEKMGVSEKDFSLYLAVRHAEDLKLNHGKEIPFTDAQIKAVMSKLDSPEMQAVQQGVIKYNNALLDLMVDAQLLTQKAVSEMRTKYPNYVPFMRYFDDDAVAGFKNGGFGSSKGFANITNPIKKMSEEGSTRTIVNPIESIVKNTMLVMNAAAKNKVGLQLAELSKKEGAGAWVESVSQLTKNGTVVKGTGAADRTAHEITVSINGEKQAFKIRDPELYNAMLSLDTESSNALIKFLGGSASLLRAGAVLTPEFIARNAFRDALGAMVNSTKYGFNPIDYFKGLGHVLGHTETLDKFLSSGGAMSTMMSLDREANREAMQAVFKKTLKDKTLNIVTSPKELAKFFTGYTPAKATIGLLRKGAELSEFSTKVGLYNKVLKKTGSMEEAAYTARDLMDFNRAGSSIRQANKAVAFLNASIQGTDKMARAFKDNPASFLARSVATLVVPSIGLYYWNKNLPSDMQEQYKNIPQWQKDNFFVIGIPHTGTFVRIPKPFEAGMIFSTGTERILEHFDAHNPDASKHYGMTLLNTFTPPAMITALTPVLEAITNYSFFTGNPIVNQGDQRFEKKDQYGLYTSETAKLAGNLLSHTPLKNTNFASPKIIDNTIKGYTAGLGGYAVSGADVGINLAKGGKEVPLPSKKLTEQPVLKAFFASTAGGGQVRDDFYKAWGKVSAKKASADKNEKPFNDPTYNMLNYGKKVIDKLNKQYKSIQTDKLLSGNQKRIKLDALDKQMNEIAAKSLGK